MINTFPECKSIVGGQRDSIILNTTSHLWFRQGVKNPQPVVCALAQKWHIFHWQPVSQNYTQSPIYLQRAWKCHGEKDSGWGNGDSTISKCSAVTPPFKHCIIFLFIFIARVCKRTVCLLPILSCLFSSLSSTAMKLLATSVHWTICPMVPMVSNVSTCAHFLN